MSAKALLSSSFLPALTCQRWQCSSIQKGQSAFFFPVSSFRSQSNRRVARTKYSPPFLREAPNQWQGNRSCRSLACNGGSVFRLPWEQRRVAFEFACMILDLQKGLNCGQQGGGREKSRKWLCKLSGGGSVKKGFMWKYYRRTRL